MRVGKAQFHLLEVPFVRSSVCSFIKCIPTTKTVVECTIHFLISRKS